MARYGGDTNRFRDEWGRASQRAADAARTFTGLSQSSFAGDVAKRAASGGDYNTDVTAAAGENISDGLNTVFSTGSAANEMLGSTAGYGLDLANRYRMGELQFKTQEEMNRLAKERSGGSTLGKIFDVARTVASFIPGAG